ncbi:unnamed protein product [Bursaphelenchus okinawaensis]|uniref:Uncharacterized protein n=1 Tax=Bursaphelenchus okinawaensis TaxID=465554 RepID=A0A811KD37_9BILA|nr:unnamed protein product [Bursaphelenchus okinawaensis]CAG9100805.1 unnamed protein product [Bursaphelenchus okinawaensis]
MASNKPIMWPPDRGFRREPPTNLDLENLSTFEKIIRYAEKDDLLLYLTALFGVFMPAVMYFVYKTAHAKYEQYAKKKREEKRREKAKQKAITLFYTPISAPFKRLAFDLAEKLECFDPVVVSLVPNNLKHFRGYKGVMVFIIPDLELHELSEEAGAWFLDWLQEMRFEAKQKDLLTGLKFATLAIDLESENDEPIGKITNNLIKRLTTLSAKQLQPPAFIAKNNKLSVDAQLIEQASILAESIRESWEIFDSDDDLSSDDESEFDIEDLEEHMDQFETENKKDK